MSKITLGSIGSNYSSTTKINENFQKLQDELNNKVHYRDNPEGEANTLSGDIDMDSNDIINAKSIQTKEVIVNGVVLPYGNNDYLPITGGALTGTLSGLDAVTNSQFTTKSQVETKIAESASTKLNISGGDMSGPIGVVDSNSQHTAMQRGSILKALDNMQRQLLDLINVEANIDDYGFIDVNEDAVEDRGLISLLHDTQDDYGKLIITQIH